jgi:hypothetical protein
MYRERKQEDLGFLEAIAEEPKRIRAALPFQPRRTSYLDRGFYFEQMERVFRFFPRHQVHVIKFDDFRKNTPDVVNKVFAFLGLRSLSKVKNRQQNRIPYERPITAEERVYLYEAYKADIAQLEQLLSWDCSNWKEP